MKKNGISLIVLIVTIIVIIILAAVVILTLSKNNPIESAKEARFKEDMRAIQDELSMYSSIEYSKNPKEFNISEINFEGNELAEKINSAKKYKDKLKVVEGILAFIGKNELEQEWARDISIFVGIPPTGNWKKYISLITVDGVPIPKGFSYVTGTKESGTVIKDNKNNEFVWIPVDDINDYKKDLTFPGYYPTGDRVSEIIPNEELDVKEYKGFYVGRYESGTPDETVNTRNDEEGIPTCKKDSVVWTNISFTNSKKNAEKMYTGEDSSVQSGLLTGKSWDTMCHFLENYIKNIDSSATLRDSRYYGNYRDSQFPANVTGYKSKQVAGFSNKWLVYNIYDIAGNVGEWTYELDSSGYDFRGGSYNFDGNWRPISSRHSYGWDANSGSDYIGFRIRLYIKVQS